MARLLTIIAVLCCTGCAARQKQLVKVVDSADLHPIQGARVWVQPWAPIHPFWPLGDRGTTDRNGEVALSFPGPGDFWFYFRDVKAVGYVKVKDPEAVEDLNHRLHVSPGTRWVFYMMRDVTGGTR